DSGSGCVGRGGGCPAIRAGIVSAAGVKRVGGVSSTPNDHLTTSPHCRVGPPRIRGVGGACSCPTVRAGIVSPAVVVKVVTESVAASAPNDHFTASPHCRVIVSSGWFVSRAGGRPAIRAGIVSEAVVPKDDVISSTPDDHFTASPHCCVTKSGFDRLDGAGGRPTVGAEIVSPAVAKNVETESVDASAPNDHFTASPHCRVTVSGKGRVRRGGGRPTIRAGVVSRAGVKNVGVVSSTPDDHFTAGPHCRVELSGSRRIGRACGRPTIRAGV